MENIYKPEQTPLLRFPLYHQYAGLISIALFPHFFLTTVTLCYAALTDLAQDPTFSLIFLYIPQEFKDAFEEA